MMDWFPSPTEKFPGLWTTSWTSLASPPVMTAPPGSTATMDFSSSSVMDSNTASTRMDSSSPTRPDIALRLPPKRSGLFDSEPTDFGLELQSVAYDQQSTHNNNQSEKLAGDLEDLDFPSQSDWMDLFGGVDCEGLVSPVDKAGECGDLLPPHFRDGSFDDIEEDLMENFTDLSNAILGADLGALPDVFAETKTQQQEEVVVIPSTVSSSSSSGPRTSGRRATKRRTAAARQSVEEAVVPSIAVPLPLATTNCDHDDYTLKPKKKPRFSTTSVEDCGSDTESVESECFSTASTSRSGSTTTAGDKYVARRQKNNVASRRSRKSRKDKFLAMEDQVETLEQANQALEEKVVMMESLAKALKQHLITRLAK